MVALAAAALIAVTPKNFMAVGKISIMEAGTKSNDAAKPPNMRVL